MKIHSIPKLYLLFSIFFLAFLSAGYPLHAQNDFGFEHLTTENGLSENFIYCIFQDSKGFLWVGTDGGLNRYDGYGFKKFQYDPSNSNSLPGNSINSICEDGQGNIWVVTNGGLCRYNYSNGQFSRIIIQGSPESQDIYQIIAVNENELMIRVTKSLYLLDIHTLVTTAVPYQDTGALKDSSGTSIPLTKDKKGNIFLMTTSSGVGKIKKYDSAQKKFTGFITFPVNKELVKESIICFLVDRYGSCWIGTEGKGKLFRSSSGEVSTRDSMGFSVLENNLVDIRSIYEDNAGNLWIAAITGLYFYDHTNGAFTHYQHSSSVNTLSSNIVNTIYQDRTGIIWIGTLDGLNKLNPLLRRFGHLTTNAGEHPALFNNFILGIYAESGNLVRIHYAFNIPSFSEFDLQKNSIRHNLIKGYNVKEYLKRVVLKNPGNLSDDTLTKMLPRLEKINAQNLPPGSLIADTKQDIWVNNGSGISCINTEESWSFKSFLVDMQLNGDNIWLATVGDGLTCLHIPTRTFTSYVSNSSKAGCISSNDVTCFIMENNGNMWVGTKGGGLNYFNGQQRSFQHYTEENGLCNNSIYSMVKDASGRIWMGTSSGLSCFDPVSHVFSNYFRSDGLVNSEYNRYSACKLDNGFLLMGGMNGIDYFNPDSLKNNSTKPLVQITDFKVFNKSIYPGHNYSLEHTDNYVTIEFAAMDFSNPAANKFAYKLEGIDKNWVALENRNFATYSVLPSGNYHFSVKAANSDNVWNDQPATIAFTILTPWWRSRWFYAACFLTLAMILFAFYRYRINQLKKLLALRSKLSQDLHDDVGASLSSIHIYSSVAEKEINENPEKAKGILRQINDSTRQVMENMSDIVWAMNTDQPEERSFTSRIKNYGYELLSQKNIECIYHIDEQTEKKLVKPDARKNILLIVKEALNNIAKYSGASRAEIHITTVGSNMLIIISDNGNGFDAGSAKKGNGLNNMKQRSALLGGSFILISSPGRGTIIKCNIPLTNISDR